MTDEELTQAIAELQEVVRCRCHEAYRDRGLKDPHCECDSAEAVKVVARHIKAITEQLAAARQDAEEAEAYAEELEKELGTCRMAQAVMDNTVADLEAKLAECEARLGKAVDLLEGWLELASHCSIEEGVCCCGDCMENHSEPMDCGHMPLDHGTYIARHLEDTTRATLAEISSEAALNKGESHDPL